MTCSNGYFISPWRNALAERLTLAPDRAPSPPSPPQASPSTTPLTSTTAPSSHELEPGTHQRLGDLVLAAQAEYPQTGAFPELLTIYHLFGDPALTVR